MGHSGHPILINKSRKNARNMALALCFSEGTYMQPSEKTWAMADQQPLSPFQEVHQKFRKRASVSAKN